MELTWSESTVVQTIVWTFLAFLSMAIVLILFFYFSRKKIVAKEIEKRELEVNHQKALLHAVLFTQEEERKRIAQDLHDDISSKLNVVTLHTHLLKTPNLEENERLEIMENIETLTGNALESARRIAHDLLPPVLEKFGLQAGVDELVLEYNTTQKVSVSRTGDGSFDALTTEKQLPVFRILQELLHNSVRHGKASEVIVNVETLATHWILNYRDNGCGFDSNDPKVRKGLGLRNIESRVGLLNGKLTLMAQPGQGVHYQITFSNEK